MKYSQVKDGNMNKVLGLLQKTQMSTLILLLTHSSVVYRGVRIQFRVSYLNNSFMESYLHDRLSVGCMIKVYNTSLFSYRDCRKTSVSMIRSEFEPVRLEVHARH